MRLIDAISRLADDARLYRLPLPVIAMPRSTLVELSILIEDDLGGTIYGLNRSGGFQFDGISFVPQHGKPRVRVKAGRRVISDDDYFLLGAQWTPHEINRFQLFRRQAYMDPIVRMRPLKPGEWVG